MQSHTPYNNGQAIMPGLQRASSSSVVTLVLLSPLASCAELDFLRHASLLAGGEIVMATIGRLCCILWTPVARVSLQAVRVSLITVVLAVQPGS
jgi:hypothetical protein